MNRRFLASLILSLVVGETFALHAHALSRPLCYHYVISWEEQFQYGGSGQGSVNTTLRKGKIPINAHRTADQALNAINRISKRFVKKNGAGNALNVRVSVDGCGVPPTPTPVPPTPTPIPTPTPTPVPPFTCEDNNGVVITPAGAGNCKVCFSEGDCNACCRSFYPNPSQAKDCRTGGSNVPPGIPANNCGWTYGTR